ncbi:hypothetical protein [Marivirga harenae]|uniref:hypothetical protein n=1 Tax=Marivirga harenae TaxID=2010992 RepID=UPI0026DF21AF|nr:hypothetical protein [Marivirga harenae]WKV12478.1 hypothetical protein Q3Y49_01340 [Marivirga harenae]
MRTCSSLFICFSFICFSLQAQTYQSYFQDASRTYREGNYPEMLSQIKKAHDLRPEHQTINYYLAMAYALNDSIDNANYWLRYVINTDAENYDPQRVDFKKLESTQAYGELLAYQKEMMEPIISSDSAFVIPISNLHIEDVAYNPYQNSYLLSSINKRNIYSYKDGDLVTFFKNNFSYAITGMVVQDSLLWFTGAGFTQAGLSESSAHFEQSKLYKADLRSGKLLDSISVEDDKNHIFGDVILTENDQLLVSDSKTNTVYRLKDDKLESWISSEYILSLQGVVQIGSKVFLADYSQGLFVFDSATKRIQKMKSLPDLSLKGIDGLYAHQGNLLAIQNGVTPHRVILLQLSTDRVEIEGFDYLEKNHPAMGEPTLGFVQKNHLIYVATSFWGLNENGVIKNEDGNLPVILKLPLPIENSNALSVLDYVKILNGKEKEAFHFYENNWAEFRRYALGKGVISGFRMMKSKSQEYDIILETRYANKSQLDEIEKHFNDWLGENPDGDFLNDLKPNEFRENVKNETVENYTNLASEEFQNQDCESENHRAFDFWLGNWEVYNKNGDHIGTNIIHIIQNACGIQENWNSKRGGAGTSYNFYNNKTGMWHQSWISNSGNALLLNGNVEDGQMIMQSEELNGKIDQIKWVPQKDGSVFQIWEISTDQGKSWSEAFWGKYVKNIN